MLAIPLDAAAGKRGPKPVPCAQRDASGRITRSMTQRAHFRKVNPCPSTGLTKGACPGWVIDHTVPLKRCGPDTPENMRWLTVQDWADKSRWE